MLIDNESRDGGSDRLFGEFDPDEFEILDEVGEEELIEQSNQIHETSKIDHSNEKDKSSNSPNESHNNAEKSNHYSDISASASHIVGKG